MTAVKSLLECQIEEYYAVWLVGILEAFVKWVETLTRFS